jgi:hypothetical protein
MFAAQIIDEDALTAKDTGDTPSASNDHNNPVEVNYNMEIGEELASYDDEIIEPYGSQFDSDQGYNPSDYDDGFVYNGDDGREDDGEVVFIRSSHVVQDNTPGGEVREGPHAIVDEDEGDTPYVLEGYEAILEGWSSMDVLHAMTTEHRLLLYKNRKEVQDPSWVFVPSPDGGLPSTYSLSDEFEDVHWIEYLKHEHQALYMLNTGFRASEPCGLCGNCNLRVDEVTFTDTDGQTMVRYYPSCRRTEPRRPVQLEHSFADLFDLGISIRAMHPTSPTDTPRVYRNSMRKPEGTMTRPLRETAETMCLTAYIEINGVKAFTLFDAGSTTDSVSPDFTRVARLHVKTLEQPVTLQLGCVGSRSKINYGTEDEVHFASINCKTYMDVANIDRYDCIIGTPFMRKHGIALDFESDEIVIRGKLRIPALPIGGGTAVTTAVTPRWTQ